MIKNRYFITGTDTHIGKTYITCGLLQTMRKQNLRTIALKPIASGCVFSEEGWRNEDALLLQKNATVPLPYSQINPFPLHQPIAPHIAADQQKISLTINDVLTQCQPALSVPADIYVIEGAGGWLLPLNATETMAEAVQLMQCQVILVVGIKLGCLNHALLTYEALLKNKIHLYGWIANCIDPNMCYIQENINFLQTKIKSPLLEIVSFNQSPTFSLYRVSEQTT